MLVIWLKSHFELDSIQKLIPRACAFTYLKSLIKICAAVCEIFKELHIHKNFFFFLLKLKNLQIHNTQAKKNK